MKKQTKQILQTVLFFLVGVALVYFQIRGLSQEDRTAVITSVKKAHFFWIGLAMLVAVISHLLRAIRWRMLINSTNDKVSTSNAFYAVMIGYFVNGFIPRAGELARCAVLGRKEKVKVEKLIGTVIVERLFDVFILFLVVGITILFQYNLIFDFLNRKLFQPFSAKFATQIDQLLMKLGLFIGLLVLLFAISFFLLRKFGIWQAIKIKLLSMKDSFSEGFSTLAKLNNKPLFVAYTLLMWVCYFFMSYTVFLSLDESKHLGVGAGMSVLTSGSLALIIPTPGGLGAYHNFVSSTLSLYDISSTTGISLSWLIWSANFIMILVVGLLSLLLISIKRNKL